MSDAEARAALFARTVACELPGTADVIVRRNVAVPAAHGPVVVDVYLPAAHVPGERRPVVLFALGYPTADLERSLKDIGAYRSWGRLVAASGLIAISHAGGAPIADAAAVVAALGAVEALRDADPARLALWSCSGNAPTALALVGATVPVRAVVLAYPYLLGFDDGADAAAAGFGFARPAAPIAVTALRAIPTLIVRAGADAQPGLNAALDRFVGAALAADLPITIVNVAGAPHGFDTLDPTPARQAAIREMLGFLIAHVGS
jgi:hypothetical protein